MSQQPLFLYELAQDHMMRLRAEADRDRIARYARPLRPPRRPWWWALRRLAHPGTRRVPVLP